MAETGTTPVSTSRRKPRGNLARLVSRFEVLDIKHGTHKKSRSSASWGPSAASDTSTHSRLKDGHDVDEQSSAGPDPFDGATDVMIDVCLSRASSCRWPSHMLHSNVEGGGGSGDDDDRQISPARALISRQKSVAERRKAFEAKYGTRNSKYSSS